ncbi:MAG TPA: hypothetical protein PKM55_11990 [Acidobacteriota bacterium]|nr:hypothetical protein [Acidobacteriota bacterium]
MEEWFERACAQRMQLSAEELDDVKYEELVRCARAAEFAYAEILVQLREIANQLGNLRCQIPVEFSRVFYPTAANSRIPGGRIPADWKPMRFMMVYQAATEEETAGTGTSSFGDGR